MLKIAGRLAATAVLIAAMPAVAAGQTFEAAGTRAAGFGGAFVAVADDATAVYWNPAGLASGSYFSVVFDRTSARLEPDDSLASGERSGLLMAIGFPALGLSYYRLRASTVFAGPGIPREPAAPAFSPAGTVRLDTLITHHTGATLVQTIVPGLDVGATFKLVRGVASSVASLPGQSVVMRLDPGESFVGKGSNKFDVDLGVMGSLGRVKAGLTIRNMTEPEFRTAGDGLAELRLERQARGGIAVMPIDGWLIAADLDLMKHDGPLGDDRIFALGAEGRVAAKAVVRGGFRLNTAAEDSRGGRAEGISVGGTYAVSPSILVDAQWTGGPDRTSRGWGVSGRYVY